MNANLDGDWVPVYYVYTLIFLPKFAVVRLAGRHWEQTALQPPGVARVRTFGAHGHAVSAVEGSLSDSETEYRAF